MKNWALLHPADPHTFIASHEVAALVVGRLGGSYAAVELGEKFEEILTGETVPYGSRNPHGWEAWFTETFERSVHESTDSLGEELARSLESMMIGSRPERRAMTKVLAEITDADERDAAGMAWNNEMRTSLYDIIETCRMHAAAVRDESEGLMTSQFLT